eukprot:scaffold42982_cov59-Phaeocystis_antarctica.AAC.7
MSSVSGTLCRSHLYYDRAPNCGAATWAAKIRQVLFRSHISFTSPVSEATHSSPRHTSHAPPPCSKVYQPCTSALRSLAAAAAAAAALLHARSRVQRSPAALSHLFVDALLAGHFAHPGPEAHSLP